MDVSLKEGIPRGFTPMDIGPKTTIAFKVRHSPTIGFPLNHRNGEKKR